MNWKEPAGIALIILGVWAIAGRTPLSDEFWAPFGGLFIGMGLRLIVTVKERK